MRAGATQQRRRHSSDSRGGDRGTAAECASEGSHAVALAEMSRGLYVDSAAVCARLVEQPGGDCMPQVGIDR